MLWPQCLWFYWQSIRGLILCRLCQHCGLKAANNWTRRLYISHYVHTVYKIQFIYCICCFIYPLCLLFIILSYSVLKVLHLPTCCQGTVVSPSITGVHRYWLGIAELRCSVERMLQCRRHLAAGWPTWMNERRWDISPFPVKITLNPLILRLSSSGSGQTCVCGNASKNVLKRNHTFFTFITPLTYDRNQHVWRWP